MRILIIENDSASSKAITNELEKNGYKTDLVGSIKDGQYYIGIRNYDLILTRWALGDGLGVDIINQLKEKHPHTPVIVIAEKNEADKEIQAFKSGVDDFLVKPLNFKILIFRMQARLKLWGSNLIEIEDLTINPDEEKITYKDQKIEVKGKPFEVLAHLARHRYQIVSKEQLLDAIWEEPELVTPNVIEVAINQIRQKMDKSLGINTIETIRRRGYRFCYPKK